MSFLARRDPTVKLALVTALSLLLILVIDPFTPFLFLVVTLIAGLMLGGLGARRLRRTAWPLALVGLGFVWTNALFAVTGAAATPLATWGPLRVSAEGLAFGAAIGLRGLAIGLLSLVFVLTTDPSRLAVSLIAHSRVPFRVVYPLLAAYRFLPFIADERAQLALARQVRGVPSGPLASLLPLLASAVRRSTRLAIAMDARGFAAARRRTYLREARLTGADVAFAVCGLARAAGILAAGAQGGWLRLWDGRFVA